MTLMVSTRRARRLLAFGSGAVVLAGMSLILGNAAPRTESYFLFKRTWERYWPLPRAKGLPDRILPLVERIGPLVPIRLELEPGVDLLLDPEDYLARKVLSTGSWEPRTWAIMDEHLR